MQTQAGPLVGPDDSRSPTIAGVLVDRRVDHLEDLHRLLREEELEVTIPGKLPAYHTVKQGLTQGEKHQLSFDRNRLINIDRSTFNRESPDYKVLQGYLARTILDFKAGSVQRPQRQKVEIRKVLEHRRATLEAVQTIADLAVTQCELARLPSSEPQRKIRGERVDLEQALAQLGVTELVASGNVRPPRYLLTMGERGDVLVEVDRSLNAGEVPSAADRMGSSLREGRRTSLPS